MDQRKRLEVKKNAGKGKRRLVRGKERWEGRRLREAGGKKWRGGKRLEGRLEGEESRRQRMYRVGKGGGEKQAGTLGEGGWMERGVIEEKQML